MAGNPKGNPQNLKSFNTMEAKKKREIQSKGGQASTKVRRERKKLKEELLLLLSQDKTQESISLALIKKAKKGDVKAFEVIRDTIGEKPTDKQEIKMVDTDWFKEG